MQKTSNYQLSQWAPEDRILREDFNSDNAKLDAALAAVDTKIAAEAAARKSAVAALEDVAGTKPLLSGSTTQSANIINIPLDTIDWGRWKAVHVDIDPYTPNSGSFSINLNGNANASFGLAQGNLSLSDPGRRRIHLILYPLFNRQRSISAVAMGVRQPGVVEVGFSFATATSLQLKFTTASEQFGAGTTYVFWGGK